MSGGGRQYKKTTPFVNRTIHEQARERATEIRTTTVWNGKGTADLLLDGLADEIERLRGIEEAARDIVSNEVVMRFAADIPDHPHHQNVLNRLRARLTT